MSEMVERVARAIFSCPSSDPLVVARETIAAMREPTEKMVMAGGAKLLNRGEYEPTAADGANDIWCAMIDVELK